MVISSITRVTLWIVLSSSICGATRFTVELQAGEYIDPFDDFTPVLVNNQICQVYALTLHGNGHRKALYSSCVPASTN